MCCGKFKKISITMYILAVLFILKYVFIVAEPKEETLPANICPTCGAEIKTTEEVETEANATTEEIIDSLFAVMDVRYNALCAERRQAYAERDAERRRELIEANDRACQEFDDSLQRFIKEYNRE